MSGSLEDEFPGLKEEGYRVTSPDGPGYNCIAWAAGDTARWWWPGRAPFAFWPEGVERAETVDAFVEAFRSLGFEPCKEPTLEAGVEKVAIFVDADGRPRHAARQLPNGRWTSKLGRREDIEHALGGVEGQVYGRVGQIVERKVDPRT